MSARVLVVEDDAAIGIALRGLLTKEGYDVELAPDGAHALESLEEEAFDLVLTDLALGDGPDGMVVLERSKARQPATPVVMITAHGTEKIAVRAMKLGADDYVPKPFDNDEIRLVVSRALARTRLEREHRLLLDRVAREHGLGALIGTGDAMRDLFSAITRVADVDLGVLVRGESGTGKELVAQAIHQRSPRAQRPFVAVNCAAISRELVESELFGHERGAFTGASAQRVGRFESADGGTLFLDEIGDMPVETQAKVLRVLQEQTFMRVGGNREIRVDVRVIAATHRDLEAEVAAGRYREDLYYRLRVVELTLPPLRQRLEDLPALARRFLERMAERTGREPKPLSASALRALASHHWPGNVRELRHAIERAAVMAVGDAIEASDLALGPSKPTHRWVPTESESFAEGKRRVMRELEREYLREALDSHAWNVSHTASAIKMARQSLQQKMRELDLERSES